MNDYNAAIRDEPYLTTAYSARGAAFFKIEQYDDAIEDYSIALRFNKNADLYAVRGLIYRTIGKLDLALQDLTEAISLEKGNWYYYKQRANIYALQRNLAGLKADCEKAASLGMSQDKDCSAFIDALSRR